MFDKDYSFWGTHARKVEMLTEPFSENSVFKLFNRNVDVYMIAPIVGFLYSNRVDEDKTDGMERKIAVSQLSPNISILEYNYKLITILQIFLKHKMLLPLHKFLVQSFLCLRFKQSSHSMKKTN